MPSIDLPLEQLLEYRPSLNRPDDFAEFWGRTLAEARDHDLNPLLEPLEYPIRSVRVHRLSYDGFAGHRIRGYYLQPETIDERPAPAVIVYHGYSGNAGHVHLHLPWVALGCAVVAIDTRGQGGETGDRYGYGSGSAVGWMTQGILEPDDYYYRRVYADCVRAIDFACSRDELDTSRLAVLGGSQGGGLSLAAASLDSRVKICLPDVPFLCHFQRAVQITTAGPYLELQTFFARHPDLVEPAMRTLAYHDVMNLTPDISPDCRMLWSVALWDDICPPSTVFAAYHHCAAPESDDGRQIVVYPYNKHEGGGPIQRERQIAFLHEALTMPL